MGKEVVKAEEERKKAEEARAKVEEMYNKLKAQEVLLPPADACADGSGRGLLSIVILRFGRC